ncbi:MAG: acetyl-coenzyme A synthetase N-terminal domain-containing protein, partial [Methanoregulaceae archaeon]
MAEDFDVRLVANARYYTPDPEYRKNAWLKDYGKTYRDFLADPEGFWEKVAHHLDWIEPWEKTLDWNYPYARWFTNAKLNITLNCLDRHVKNARKNKVAIIWRG